MFYVNKFGVMQMYKIKCQNCGKHFESERPRKFCSVSCFLAYRKKQAIANKIEQLKLIQQALNEVKTKNA